ncbi:MAG: S-ribosylhomocysteine lyase [Sarcina sp.]
MQKVESFELDHTKVVAPYVREAGVLKGQKGDIVTKFDIRFVQPNKEMLEIEGIHTLEHFLATFMRDKLTELIDISPMGCRTGFYMVTFGEVTVDETIEALNYALGEILKQEEIPAANETQCGSYKLHSLELAKEYSRRLLDEGVSNQFYKVG